MSQAAVSRNAVPDVVKRIRRGELLRSRSGQAIFEGAAMASLVGCALFSVLTTFVIIAVLVGESILFFKHDEVSVADFLLGTHWNPRLGAGHFGVWPLLSATLMITLIAMLVALPLGLIAAIYLSEFAPRRVRTYLKPALEILAGIPTVVFGFFAVTVITPALQFLLPRVDDTNALSAGIAVGILCIPIVCSLSEDALRAVPRGLRDGALGLGGTRFDVAIKVVVPAALSGIVSAFLLAIVRAMGETMVVMMAAGKLAQLSPDPRLPMMTMTGYMAEVSTGDVSNFGVEYYSMYAVGLVLFLLTFGLTVIGNIVRLRYRETYK
jgi:phosphate transport system permease protein